MIPAEVERGRRLSAQIAEFEGLVFETARQLVYEEHVEMDFDDVRQFLRQKVWRAIEEYDSARDKRLRSLKRFVFGCVVNARKDVIKRPRRFTQSIDELRDDQAMGRGFSVADTQNRSDRFDGRYLSTDEEEVFAQLDTGPPLPCLSELERQVAQMRAEDFTLAEIDLELGLVPGQAKIAMRSAREKLAHRRPRSAEPRTAPLRPLPGAEPRTARAPAILAA